MHRRRAVAALSLGLSLLLAANSFAADRKPTRALLKEAESRFDAMIQKQWTDDPYVLLGNTRAIYVDGYGVIMTSEINLVTGPTVSPFNPSISKEAIGRHRDKKLSRLPQLKQLVKSAAENARTWFPDLADTDTIVIGVTLLKYSWEEAAGIPAQVIAVMPHRKDAAVKLQEN
jgi:hypothetical protein